MSSSTMSYWKRSKYPGDAVDQRIRDTARGLVADSKVKAVAIVVIDADGLAHGNVAMTGVGLGPTAENTRLTRQLAERLFEYQDSLS